MDKVKQIRRAIEEDMREFDSLFSTLFQHENPLLQQVLNVVSARRGKQMRPMLTLLCAKIAGDINRKSYLAAASFELFHTSSLIHDDVVDESNKRRGQESVNAAFGNKVAVLSGDYLLSLALKCCADTGLTGVVDSISCAGQFLASGELLQLYTVGTDDFSEDTYFTIIKGKTAALFASCARAGAISVSASKDVVERLEKLGEYIGICFQIKDDIFDYYTDDIGKPTGNDMAEGKLTLPVLYVLNQNPQNQEMRCIAKAVKEGRATAEEIAQLIDFTKQNGGIDYAVKVMNDYAQKAYDLIKTEPDSDVKSSLEAYIQYITERTF